MARRSANPGTPIFGRSFEDVGERPSDLHFLYRPDKAIPMGERNAIWSVSKGGPPRDAEHTAERRTRKEEMRDYLRGRRGGDPFYDLRIGLKVAHGISLEDFERMLDSQDGVCAICGRPEHRRSTTAGRAYRLAVDHERGTATIRGLLCSMCNHAIGYLDDSPELLERAIAYLRDPPAAKLGIAHNGKHKTRRIERQPSPHLERHVKPQIAREEVKPIIFPLSTAAGEHKAAQDRGLAESFRQTREACPPSDPRPKGGSWGISLLWNAGGERVLGEAGCKWRLVPPVGRGGVPVGDGDRGACCGRSGAPEDQVRRKDRNLPCVRSGRIAVLHSASSEARPGDGPLASRRWAALTRPGSLWGRVRRWLHARQVRARPNTRWRRCTCIITIIITTMDTLAARRRLPHTTARRTTAAASGLLRAPDRGAGRWQSGQPAEGCRSLPSTTPMSAARPS